MRCTNESPRSTGVLGEEGSVNGQNRYHQVDAVRRRQSPACRQGLCQVEQRAEWSELRRRRRQQQRSRAVKLAIRMVDGRTRIKLVDDTLLVRDTEGNWYDEATAPEEALITPSEMADAETLDKQYAEEALAEALASSTKQALMLSGDRSSAVLSHP